MTLNKKLSKIWQVSWFTAADEGELWADNFLNELKYFIYSQQLLCHHQCYLWKQLEPTSLWQVHFWSVSSELCCVEASQKNLNCSVMTTQIKFAKLSPSPSYRGASAALEAGWTLCFQNIEVDETSFTGKCLR